MNCSVCHLCKLSIAYRHTSPSNQTLCNRCRTSRTSWWWTRGWWRRAKSSRWRYCSTTVLSSPWVINRNCKFSPWCIWDKKRPRRDEKSQNGKSRPEKLPTSEKFTFLTKILQSHYGCRLMRCLCDLRDSTIQNLYSTIVIIFLQLNGYSTLNVEMIFSDHLLFYISSSVSNLIFKFL